MVREVLYTKEQLDLATPSRRDGIDAQQEARYRRQYCELVSNADRLLKLCAHCIAPHCIVQVPKCGCGIRLILSLTSNVQGEARQGHRDGLLPSLLCTELPR